MAACLAAQRSENTSFAVPNGPWGEWSGQAEWWASRDCCNGAATFLADLRFASCGGNVGSALVARPRGTPQCHQILIREVVSHAR